MGLHALVIEGGGMKAAFANGVLTAFEEADYKPFDVVLGASAGGALGAWFSAGQARWAEATWSYAGDPRIMNVRRFLTRRGPLLDHEALLDIVYQDEHPLDVAAVRRAPWPMVVVVADVETGDVIYQDLRERDVIGWLKATGRLPFGSGLPVELEGRRFLDGGIIDPIPVRHAVEVMGADRVTLISNNPPGPKKTDSRLLAELVSRRYPMLRHGITNHQSIKAAAIEYALAPPDGVRIDVIRPAGPTGLSRLGRDMEAISAGLERGRRDGAQFVADQG